MVGDVLHEDVGRKHPARGVHIYSGQPTIVFLTICAQDRRPWLADPVVHDHLQAAWRAAQTWLVGYYLLMPEHLHLFCAPHDPGFTLEKWVTFWKRKFRRLHKDSNCRWQSNPFHHRLRREESYEAKWNYVRENPLRKGLAKCPEDWPYQGMMNTLPW
jgi:putative transposase